MKKCISLILSCVLFFGCLHLTAFAKTSNLLENGGFETGDKTGFNLTGPMSIQRVTTDSAHSGSYGLSVKDRVGRYSTVMADLTDLAARGGKGEYEFSLWIRAAAPVSGRHSVMLVINYAFPNEATQYITSDPIKLSTEWKQITMRKTLDFDLSAADHIWFYPQVEGPNNADFFVDDVVIVKNGEINGAPREDYTPLPADMDPSGELLKNGGFETNYWDDVEEEDEDEDNNFFKVYGPSNNPIFDKAYAHSGELGVCITDREGVYSTMLYDATDLVSESGTGEYLLTVWLKLQREVDYDTPTQLVINYGQYGAGASYKTSEAVNLTTEWTKFSVSITVDFTLTYMWFYPQLTGRPKQGNSYPSFCMDDMSLIKFGEVGKDVLDNVSGDVEFDKELIDVSGQIAMPGSMPTLEDRPEVSTVGVIRWDAWFGDSTRPANVGSQVEKTLSPAHYHFRAPFFASVTEEGTIKLPDYTQEIFDREMEYAIDAGISYYVYNWYSDEMREAREFHLTSKYRTQLKACPMLTGNSSDETKYDVAKMLQSDAIMTVFGGRPLMFYFASKIEAIKSDIQYFQKLCRKLGLPAPYSVTLNFSSMQALGSGADGFGYYAITGLNGQSYESLTKIAENHWEGDRIADLPNVLCVTAGWHNLPRYEHPVTWGGEYVDYSWAEYATDEEIYQHVKNAFTFLQKDVNKKSTILNTMLIYAWNEHDEGGWICPTIAVDENGNQLYNEDGTPKINTGRLEAVKRAIAEYRATVKTATTDPNDPSGGGLQVWQIALIAAGCVVLIGGAVTVIVIAKKKKPAEKE